MVELFLILSFLAVFCGFLLLGLAVFHLSATLTRSWRKGFPIAFVRRRKP